MAVSSPHYQCLRELHRRSVLPQGDSILEIGEANWYGDIAAPEEIKAAVASHLTSPLLLFHVVKALYEWLFSTQDVQSIDMNGSPAALRIDLNDRIDLGRTFATVINHGTLEHVFNAAQAFKTIHDHCRVGGLMIHESPFTGWIDHGFVTFQPTLFFDLAASNCYELRFLAVTEIESGYVHEYTSRDDLLAAASEGRIPNNAMLFVALTKTTDGEFRIPMQGYYANRLSESAKAAWSDLR